MQAGHLPVSHTFFLIKEEYVLTPDIAGVAVQVATGECFGYSRSVADGSSGGVDEPSALLHLGDELLVKQAFGSLVKRAVLSFSKITAPTSGQDTHDSHNIALSKHVFELLDSAGLDTLLGIW